MNTQFWVVQAFNGISYGALLFLVGSGLSLIFGVMRIVNLAHGAYFLWGGYIALSVIGATGSWALSLPVAALAVAAIGIAMERLFLRSEGFEYLRNARDRRRHGPFSVALAVARAGARSLGDAWIQLIVADRGLADDRPIFCSAASQSSRSRTTCCARCCSPSASPSCSSKARSTSGAATTWTSIRRARSPKAS